MASPTVKNAGTPQMSLRVAELGKLAGKKPPNQSEDLFQTEATR